MNKRKDRIEFRSKQNEQRSVHDNILRKGTKFFFPELREENIPAIVESTYWMRYLEEVMTMDCLIVNEVVIIGE